MAEIQGVQGDTGGRRALTPEQIERKKALGIPVHLSEEDCDYRADGYCNCGERRPGVRRQDGRVRTRPGLHGKPNIDSIERNWKEYN